MKSHSKAAVFLTMCLCLNSYAETQPQSFVHLSEIAPTIQQDMRYFTYNNFIGRPINGYQRPTCILTRDAAEALQKVQQTLQRQGLGLKVFDCYRPQRAVNQFVEWSKDIRDQKMKAEYYPRVNKAEFFKLGYVLEHSDHTRGSTVDLTIIDLATHKPLDMGTHFDFMDPRSHSLNHSVTQTQFKNRMRLRTAMHQFNFQPIDEEWWHFTLKNGPYKNTYFNFLVK